jgi:hypothetical protein
MFWTKKQEAKVAPPQAFRPHDTERMLSALDNEGLALIPPG